MTGRFRELTGVQFGNWTVIQRDGTVRRGPKSSGATWLCRCVCGRERILTSSALGWGNPESCGCKRGTHRHSRPNKISPTYSSWKNMMGRCYQPSNPAHTYYKSRGISVCERWHTFANFLADMGEKEIGLTLDRINNDGDYEPGNCRWATRKEQADNRKTNLKYEYPAGSGQFYNLVNLCKKTGVSLDLLRSRLTKRAKRMWTVEEAVKTPVIPYRLRRSVI